MVRWDGQIRPGCFSTGRLPRAARRVMWHRDIERAPTLWAASAVAGTGVAGQADRGRQRADRARVSCLVSGWTVVVLSDCRLTVCRRDGQSSCLSCDINLCALLALGAMPVLSCRVGGWVTVAARVGHRARQGRHGQGGRAGWQGRTRLPACRARVVSSMMACRVSVRQSVSQGLGSSRTGR